MRFNQFADELKKENFNFTIINNADTELNFLSANSRNVRKGTIFACVKGDHTDGHNFAHKAVEQGASALLCERRLDISVPQIICDDVRSKMGYAAACLYGNPVKQLKMAAITGTSGKTSSTYMTKAILDFAGIKCGLLGTICYDDGLEIEEAPRTTPEADVIQYKLNKMVKNGCKACVMEASSHAIVQGRLSGCKYDAIGFTNLTQDHLDYHKTMDRYFEAKLGLFKEYVRKNWKVSAYTDNVYSRKVYEIFAGNAVSYSMQDNRADYFAELKSVAINGMEVSIKHGKTFYNVVLPIIGRHNILNALQALSITEMFGVSTETGINALQAMPQIPGRLEKYVIRGSGSCVIDFAHAPDGIEQILTTLRSVCKGRLIAVFGAGGDRDKTKRPIMGDIAGQLADYVILTSDNPRTEDPETIIDELEKGIKKHNTPYARITNRRDAIYNALTMLTKDDIVAIIGKGPESYMEVDGKKIPFMDKSVVLDWCEQEGRETE